MKNIAGGYAVLVEQVGDHLLKNLLNDGFIQNCCMKASPCSFRKGFFPDAAHFFMADRIIFDNQRADNMRIDGSERAAFITVNGIGLLGRGHGCLNLVYRYENGK